MKKIFYVPGLISACIIPVLFWYYGNRKLNEPIPNVMDLGLPAKIDPTRESAYQDTFEYVRNWDYKKIVVAPNTARKNSKFYVSEIKKLQQRNQKETGIEFILTDENSYDDFTSLLNDMAIAKHDMYGIDMEKTGNIFTLVNYKNPNAKEIEYECLLCNDVVMDWEGYYRYTHRLNYENFKNNISQLPKEAFYLIFGFLVFLNISMFSIKKSFQIH